MIAAIAATVQHCVAAFTTSLDGTYTTAIVISAIVLTCAVVKTIRGVFFTSYCAFHVLGTTAA